VYRESGANSNAAFGSITGEKGHGQRQMTFGIKLMY
jgi:hypothetical protein